MSTFRFSNWMLAPGQYGIPERGVGQTQAWMPTYASILRIPQMIRVWRATAE
jgi:hypothetical protein